MSESRIHIIAQLLEEPVQQYIAQHLKADVQALALQKNVFSDELRQAVLQQIQAKQKVAKKLPTWYQTPHILYPASLSIEQASSEQTAAYKSKLIQGKTAIDLTGGFGIDSYFLSKSFQKVIHIEQDEYLSAIAEHNFIQLSATNIECVSQDSLSYLTTHAATFDAIYIDPARRNSQKNKVFLLEDCTPNMYDIWSLLQQKSRHIWFKTSPLLDIHDTIKKLPDIVAVYIIAVENEVKELLFHADVMSATNQPVEIFTVNIKKNHTEEWSSVVGDTATSTYATPLQFLYLPNAALMKSGQYNNIAQDFGLLQLHKHSHLYTADQCLDFFPGKKFSVIATIPYKKQHFKTIHGITANVSTRNFPEKSEYLSQKHKIKNGGNTFLFFTTLHTNEKVVIHCSPIP
jgi:16S rRNA G966 N2-methylase RsmD